MDEQIQETKGTGRVLRQKIVNLLYLIFIVLAFLYIPSNFVDLFSEINKSFESAKDRYFDTDSYDLYHYDLQIFEYLIELDQERGEELQDNFSIISKSSTALIEKIEQYKYDLISEAGGIDKYGYSVNAKNYNHTEHILLDNNQADSLLLKLKGHSRLIGKLAGNEVELSLDSILPTSDNIVLSSGKKITWSKYYFEKNPVAGAITILSMFQLGLKKADQIVLDSYIKLLNMSGDNIDMGISKKNYEGFNAVLKHNNSLKVLKIDNKNLMRFIAGDPGLYQLMVSNEMKKVDVNLNIVDPKLRIISGQYPVLYVGIDNKIEINHDEIANKDISIISSKGEIIYNNQEFYLRTESTGIAEITVFGKRNQKNILLVKQTFEIKNLPDLYAYIIDEKKNNIEVKTGFKPVSFLKSQTKLRISSKTEKNLSFPVKNFNLKRITTNNKIQSRTNRGGDFRERTIQLINVAKPGDIYIFDNIKAENVFGSEFNVPSVVYYIK